MRGSLANARERELLTTQEVADRYKLGTRDNARVWCRRHGVPRFSQAPVRYDARDVDAAFRRLQGPASRGVAA